jgi:hypothetical protein
MPKLPSPQSPQENKRFMVYLLVMMIACRGYCQVNFPAAVKVKELCINNQNGLNTTMPLQDTSMYSFTNRHLAEAKRVPGHEILMATAPSDISGYIFKIFDENGQMKAMWAAGIKVSYMRLFKDPQMVLISQCCNLGGTPQTKLYFTMQTLPGNSQIVLSLYNKFVGGLRGITAYDDLPTSYVILSGFDLVCKMDIALPSETSAVSNPALGIFATRDFQEFPSSSFYLLCDDFYTIALINRTTLLLYKYINSGGTFPTNSVDTPWSRLIDNLNNRNYVYWTSSPTFLALYRIDVLASNAANSRVKNAPDIMGLVTNRGSTVNFG